MLPCRCFYCNQSTWYQGWPKLQQTWSDVETIFNYLLHIFILLYLVSDCAIFYMHNGVCSNWFPDRCVQLHGNNLGVRCWFSRAVQMWHQRTNGTTHILSPIDCGILGFFSGICHSCVGSEKMFLHFCHNISNVLHSGLTCWQLCESWVPPFGYRVEFLSLRRLFSFLFKFFVSNMKITQFWTLLATAMETENCL